MTRTILRVLPCTFLLAAAVLNGQTQAQPDNIAHVTLGQSAVPLYGPWKFTVGDSPIDPKTGQPLWAEPDFDDSKWETVDLTPKDGAFDPAAGLPGYVPGWTAKGHPGYFGYAWYRIRVEVRARPGAALALAGPANVDDAYQVFDNGELAGHFGDLPAACPWFTTPSPKRSRCGSWAAATTGPVKRGPDWRNPRGFWPSGYGWSLSPWSTSPIRAACTRRRCWARRARWRPAIRCAGWN